MAYHRDDARHAQHCRRVTSATTGADSGADNHRICLAFRLKSAACASAAVTPRPTVGPAVFRSHCWSPWDIEGTDHGPRQQLDFVAISEND
jgi:hypothetical protein